MRELITPHVMHLMSSSFVNIFLLEVFGYKRFKMYLTKSTDKRMIQLSLYFCSLYKNYSALLMEKHYLFRISMFADRYFDALPWHKKSQQSASKVTCPCLLLYSFMFKCSSCVGKRMCVSLNQLLNKFYA